MSQFHPEMRTRFSDLLEVLPGERPRLLPSVHHIPELLDLDAEEVLARFKKDQEQDFRRVIAEMGDRRDPLFRMFDELKNLASGEAQARFNALPIFHPSNLEALFLELHEHVMDHPVWRHPFFLRVFRGDITKEQLARFALQYFNQVKNTRQCVALALGRFSGLMDLPYGTLNERISELTQIVLAQLLADEYGVGTHDVEAYPSLAGLFQSETHIVMYRKLFDGLGIPFAEQDVPLLPEVADNVLTQRLVAGSDRFTNLEALASVGLGMEWGVPEFFSLLLGGMIRVAWNNNLPLDQQHLHVFIAHVKYDVLHAISVMLVTSFFSDHEEAIGVIKGATNILMSGRYEMMSGVYRHVFNEPCESLTAATLPARYHLMDRRIEQALIEARGRIAPATVINGEDYRSRKETPFIFAV